MTDTETPTWRNAQASAAEAAREWVRDEYTGDADAVHDAAWEYADGTADVIWTYRARAIWVDSSEVQAQEDEVDGMIGGSDDSADIDRRITLCVFLAIRDAFAEAALEAIAARDDDTCAECGGAGTIPATGADQYAGTDDNGLVPCEACNSVTEGVTT